MEADITIIGGGLAGLIAAIKYSQMGFRIICVDVNFGAGKVNDFRSTALLLPSIQLLKDCNLWQLLEEEGSPLSAIKIFDVSSANNEKNIEFNASEIGEEYFGYNVANQNLFKILKNTATEDDNIKLITNDEFIDIKTRTGAAYIELRSGKRITCKLLIGADGRNSSVRETLSIKTTIIKYDQDALAFTISHAHPHSNISVEIYESGGPFTIVPLKNPNESAIIWMDKSKSIKKAMQLDIPEFEKSITHRSGNCLGALKLTSEFSSWPIINQLAQKITSNRCALIAEAAHVLPPIGAQGLNMSIQDIRILGDIIDGTQDPGSYTNLINYEKIRKKKIVARSKIINGLNLSSIPENKNLQKARQTALDLIGSSSMAKNLLINIGLSDS